MRIIADLNELKHAFILGSIICCQFSEPKQIRFLVDTGASLTTILSYDTLKLGIDCTKLSLTDGSFSTANGTRKGHDLKDVELKLNTNDGTAEQSTVTLSFKSVPCFSPPTTIDESVVSEDTYSILGMDVLFLFKKWQYTDKTLILEQ